jgi:hypothetical protein
MSDADIVFCDPDNGIAKPGSDYERSGSVKHILLSEIETLHRRGHGVVVYHHLGREVGGHDRQIEWWIQQLGERISVSVAAVRFRRGTSRAFFLISGGRAPRVVDRLELLRESA